MLRGLFLGWAAILAAGHAPAVVACEKRCLEQIATQYRTAYLAHDASRAPFAANVRFTENDVEMRLPDGTWDTVTREIGPALTISDPMTGNVGVYTSIMQNEVPGFLAIRIGVQAGKIAEVEHVVATQRNVSLGRVGDVEGFTHDPDFARPVAPEERMSRADLIRLANGYFSTLENNDGKLRDARFSSDAIAARNGLKSFPGMKFFNIQKILESGFFRFNDRVRDRDFFLVDEARGVVMARAYIDHKGRLDRYTLTDGTDARSPYLEPQTWSVLEMFKIKKGEITGIEATLVHTPYNMRSPWTKRSEGRAGGITSRLPPPPASTPAPTNAPLE